MTPRMPVRSSLLSALAYSGDATLDVEFRNGAVYRYFAVPRSVFDALLASESKGACFNHLVRGRFPFERLG